MARRRGWGGHPPGSDGEATTQRITAAAVALIAETAVAMTEATLCALDTVRSRPVFGLLISGTRSQDDLRRYLRRWLGGAIEAQARPDAGGP